MLNECAPVNQTLNLSAIAVKGANAANIGFEELQGMGDVVWCVGCIQVAKISLCANMLAGVDNGQWSHKIEFVRLLGQYSKNVF